MVSNKDRCPQVVKAVLAVLQLPRCKVGETAHPAPVQCTPLRNPTVLDLHPLHAAFLKLLPMVLVVLHKLPWVGSRFQAKPCEAIYYLKVKRLG